MKNLFKLPVLALGLVLLLSGITQKVQAQDDDISLQTFYDELSPYGTWIQDQEYGYVWRPDVDQSEFRPYYSSGRWVMTEYGNTWVSDYDWGWAPFHYGRWIQNRYNDWLWVPDTVWGPAWVSWRSGGGYYGWAPLTPGFNININFGGGYNIPNSYWCFIPQAQIYYNNYPRYRSYRNVTIIRNTTIINYTGQRNRNNYFTGPRRDDIRRATNQDVRVYNVNRSNRAGRSTISGNAVNIYNPRNSRGGDNKNAAPREVVKAGDYNATRAARGGRTDNNQSATGARNNRQQGAQGQRGEASQRMDRGTTRDREPQTAAQQQQAQAQRAERSRQQQASGQQPAQADRVNRSNQEQAQAQRQDQTQRVERSRQQETQAQAERSRQQQAQAQQQQQQQTAERSRQQETQVQEQRSHQQQAQAQQQEQAQRAERSRQQETQAQEQRSRQAQAQQQQQQQQRQERSRQQETQRAPQVQQQRQERVQQSAPRSESRGGGEAQSAGRSSRGGRG